MTQIIRVAPVIMITSESATFSIALDLGSVRYGTTTGNQLGFLEEQTDGEVS